MGGFITKYWIEALFGFLLTCLSVCYKRLATKYKKEIERQEAIEKGLQALLRSQMINDYNHYKEKGYAPIYAKENFENCWQQYHNLGVNGVMDGVHKEFMELPSAPDNDE